MYTKSKNNWLFVIFILIILLIVGILIMAVYSTKQSILDEYKVSLNNVLYDEDYNFVSLEDDAVIKKEWDDNFYLYASDNIKYSLGTESVLYDKSTRQVTIYGTVYQVFTNGDVSETDNKTTLSKLDDFQFFKLNDRKYLIIGDKITSVGLSTFDYLIVSIDKAGNASLLNHSVNIKTINPLNIYVNDINFDVANEKLIVGEEQIDLKKINGSTNEYVQGESQNNLSNGSGGSGSLSGGSGSNSGINSDNGSNQGFLGGNYTGSSSSINNNVYKEIINQLVTISGMIPSNNNKTSLYKNVSLRDVTASASYVDIFYSIIDPENKYLKVYLAIQKIESISDDVEDLAKEAVNCDSPEVECIILDKGLASYRKTGLTPSSQYMISLNYLESGSSEPSVADVVSVVTEINPTSVRIIKQDYFTYTYRIKLYNEYAIKSANVVITNCNGTAISQVVKLDINSALTADGAIGEITRNSQGNSQENLDFVCLELRNVLDANNNEITINSYHKIKINELGITYD